MKNLKTRQEFVDYMWKAYPNDNQLPEREGMLKAYNFLTGTYDFEEREREKIKKSIGEEMKRQGFGKL